MDENKEKFSGSDGKTVDPIHEEMEELARVFKEELDKAKKEAENDLLEPEKLEVEGYNPQAVSVENKESLIFEEQLCEYCGEKPRGTEKNPHSPYCERCESVLEKYPYDLTGIIIAFVTFCITIGAIVLFALNVPAFTAAKEGDKAVEEGRLYTALEKYSDAIVKSNLKEYYGDQGQKTTKEKTCYNLHAKSAMTYFKLVSMNSAITQIDENIPDFVLKLPAFKKLNDEVLEQSEIMQASALVAQQHLAKYPDVTTENYDKIINELENLVGKKVYIKGSEYHDETEKDFTPDGTETVYICDEGWIRMYQYAAAQQVGKDQKTIAGYLQKCADTSDYMWTLVSSLLASTYAGTGEYEKAEEILAKMKENNIESSEWYMVQSLIYRYRDKDYDAAQKICDEGLEMLVNLPNGEFYLMQYGSMLQIQKTLNYIMQDEIKLAYDTVSATYEEATLSGGLTIQIRDLYAMLAYATGDTEVFEGLEKEIQLYGDDSIAFTSDVTDFKDGKLTLKEIAESGRYDLI